MEVSDKAVRAAQKAYRECEGDSTESHRAALTAALPFLPVQVAVKKLEWAAHKGDQHCKIAWTCEGIGGWYAIEHRHEGHFDMWTPNNPDGGRFITLETAKAAAQADYEARILSALEPSAARELALEEILREVDEVERKVWAWSGSAFLNNELEGAEDADCKTELYRELCGIGNTMHWLRTKICALSSPDHIADAGKVEGDGWLPIESAPKDGTPVLAYQAGRYFKCWLECDRYEGGYFWQDEEDSEPSPTHWRPLPSAPSEGAE